MVSVILCIVTVHLLQRLLEKHDMSQPSIVPVQLPIKSITQYPLTGTYCRVMILIASWAMSPPNKAAVFGSSAVGARALEKGKKLPPVSDERGWK